jgi:hypothetical protein
MEVNVLRAGIRSLDSCRPSHILLIVHIRTRYETDNRSRSVPKVVFEDK